MRKALLAFALLALVGCGGEETAPSDGNKAKQAITADDQAVADQAVLTLSDFPAGWRAEKPDDDDDDENECFDPDFSAFTLTGKAESDDFEKGDATFVKSLAAVFESEDQGRRAHAALADEGLASCLADYMKEQSDSEARVTDTSFGTLSFPSLGDESSAHQVVVQLESGAFNVDAYFDIVTIRQERTVALMFFVDILSPFFPDDEHVLAAKVAGRMGADVSTVPASTSSYP